MTQENIIKLYDLVRIRNERVLTSIENDVYTKLRTEYKEYNKSLWLESRTQHVDNSAEQQLLTLISAVPERYAETINFADIKSQIPASIVIEFDNQQTGESSKTGLYFCGQVGTGKTRLLYLLASLLRISDKHAIVISSLQLLQDIRNGWQTKENTQAMYEQYHGHLFIDDIGVELELDSSRVIMYGIIDERYKNKLSTTFASNLSLPELSKKYDARIAGRIQESCEIINITGKDHRI